jgi:hypothetical protein
MKLKLTLLSASFVFSLAGISQTDTLQRAGYLYSKFTPGKVLFKTGMVQNANLNYNTNTSAIAYDNKGDYMIVTNPEDIDTVFIAESKFVSVNDRFYEVENLSKDVTMLIWYKNTLRPIEATTDHTGTITTNTDVVNNNATAAGLGRKFKDNYKVVFLKQFAFKKTDKNILYKVDSEKTLIKTFPEKEEEIKSYLSSHKISLKNEKDLSDLIATLFKK